MLPTKITLRDTTWASGLRLVQSWVDSVQALLSGGSRLSEQMAGETLSVAFNRDSPPTVRTKLARPPATVVCLDARLSSGAVHLSGCPVQWTWAGDATVPRITINDVVGLVASTDYTLTLWLSEG